MVKLWAVTARFYIVLIFEIHGINLIFSILTWSSQYYTGLFKTAEFNNVISKCIRSKIASQSSDNLCFWEKYWLTSKIVRVPVLFSLENLFVVFLNRFMTMPTKICKSSMFSLKKNVFDRIGISYFNSQNLCGENETFRLSISTWLNDWWWLNLKIEKNFFQDEHRKYKNNKIFTRVDNVQLKRHCVCRE